MRTRLAVFYAVLFLLAGVVLLALSYALMASVLLPAAAPPPKLLTPQERALLGLCKPLPTSRVAARAMQPPDRHRRGRTRRRAATRWPPCGKRR